MTIILAALVAVLGAVYGAFWALVRDQDGPYMKGKPVKFDADGNKVSNPNKWKEAGVGQIAIVFGGLTAWAVLSAGLIEAAAWGVGAGAMSAYWWSQGHKKGLDMVGVVDWIAMAGTGAGITVGPAAALAWHGSFVLAALVLLSGAMKAPAYWLGYRIRGRGAHPHPHATQIGHMLHGAIAYGVTAACMVLA